MTSSQLLQEVQVQDLIGKHPNVLSFTAAFEDASSVYLVSNLCNRGELPLHLSQEGAVSERGLADAFAQLMEGVWHCHKHGKP